MKLSDILIKAGGAVISEVVPGGGLIVNMINEFLPDEYKLTDRATGKDAHTAITKLAPQQQAELFAKELDVQITEINAWANVQAALAEADATGQSTRPKIALMMAWLVVMQVTVVSGSVGYAALTENTEVIKVLSDTWQMLLASMGIPTTILYQYFGKRTKEKIERYNLAMGQQTPTLLNTLKAVIGK